MGLFIETNRIYIVFTILALLAGKVSTFAQEEPKIGLVLSGGGAKGMAHIGALKVIEEAGIKIDYVGGTSMGAIIGGLYAAGYTANQLDSIFRNTNLGELIQDNVPRGAKNFYEKEDSERYALSLPFDDFKVSFPAGISTGQNIYNQFVQLLYHVKEVNDFNDLSIPFVCIATNIETGEPVVMNRGYLPEAIMASGTLPSLFEPTEIDEQVLIDGGVVNNYPIDQVRALGADFVIGVDVQDALAKRESLSSATDILLQINNYRTVRDMILKKGQTDIYIKPDIEAYTVIDFEKTDEIIDVGSKAAEALMDDLKALATRQSKGKNVRKPQTIPDSLTINRLIIEGNERYSRGYIKGMLRFNIGDKISFGNLRQGMNNLAATENFNAIRYQLVSNGLGTDLVLKLMEKPNRLYLKVGAHFDDLFKSAALLNLTRKNLLLKDDVASFDIILGDHVRYDVQYYVDKGTYWSFGINSSFADLDEEIDFRLINDNFQTESAVNINTINLDFSDWTNQIYLQTLLREEFALTLGVEHKLLRFSTRTFGEQNLQQNTTSSRTFFENSNYYSAYGKLKLDTYDDRYFPSSGLLFDGDFHLYLFSSDFNQNFREFSVAKARMGSAFGILPRLSLNLETEGGFKLGTSDVTSFDFVLGGFGSRQINNLVPFLGYDFLSLPGNSYVKAYSRLDYEIAPKNHLLFMANAANVEDDIFRTGEWFTSPDYWGYGVGFGLESFIGPMQLLYSYTPDTKSSEVFISIGYWF